MRWGRGVGWGFLLKIGYFLVALVHGEVYAIDDMGILFFNFFFLTHINLDF